MTVFNGIAKPAALLLALGTMTCMSTAAQAGAGWLWFDTVFASPAGSPVTVPHRVQRAKPGRVATQLPVAKPILVSAVSARRRSDCFWCNRPVFISGLSF